MAKFLDHCRVKLPPDAVKQVTAGIKAGKADQFGVKPLNVFMAEDGAYCLTEAPSADAVVKMHQANGIPLDRRDVSEVTTLV